MTIDDWKIADHHNRPIVLALPLREPSSVGRVLNRIEVAARHYLRDYDANESKYTDIELIQRRNGKTALMVTRRRHESRGRVRRDAMRAYITALVTIYERATGKRIGRSNNDYTNQATRHPFLLACSKAVGKRYPGGIIQEVLEQLHPDAKLGRPSARKR
ncbi:MAG TPA: hypothetical protein VMU26_00690 [Candidatus Polarisedimenticolia bacterium]|nr:hypothetical protein [Candidatus Polarisedimenticolia bacterium]